MRNTASIFYRTVFLVFLTAVMFLQNPAAGFSKTVHGYVSWYGPGFHARKTANGEDYDMYGLSAAHRTLPFDTLVEVYNKRNHRKCIVRVNDRGPVSKSLLMDLSYGGAMAVGSRDMGKASVKLTVVGDTKQVYDKDRKFYVFLDDKIILPHDFSGFEFDKDDEEYYRNIAGGIEIFRLTQKHIARLYQANIFRAPNLLVAVGNCVCIGPFATFGQAEKIYHNVATQYPHAAVWLENPKNAKKLVVTEQ